MEFQDISMDLAGRTLKFTSGPITTYANGSAVVSYGDTVVMGNASMTKKARDGASFFPMVVDYEENYFAAGKIKGSRFIKREGRPSENSVLIARLIDRPMRPLFPKGTRNEVQIIASALAFDGAVNPATTAIIASSLALMLSGAPFAGPVSAVRVGYLNDELIINPTYDQVESGKLDLVVAGTLDAITMVEAAIKEVPEEVVLKALEMAHAEIKKICQMQLDYVAKFEVTPIEAVLAAAPVEASEAVASFITNEMLDGIVGKTKMEVKHKIEDLEEALLEKFASELEEEVFSEGQLKDELNSAFEKRMRHNILTAEKRIDGRSLTDVRPVQVFADPLPKNVHGSALFQRGETMSLSVATLGGPGDAQIVDTMDNDITKRYFHHYKFPPYSVGEIRMLRGPGRREIGHGTLAERALEPVIPEESVFPYTIWVHSLITRCNGSSSMASVCGSTLSLMAAGVPIKAPVAGIAMGLVTDKETGAYKILSDIQGMEDFAGDMDFKVTGTSEGLTALQMDIKVKGLSMDIMREALEQAKAGREHIMSKMLEVIPEPRKELSPHAPMILSIQIKPDQIGMVIGKGGETIQKITKECGVEIDITEEGQVNITAPDGESGKKAKEWIEQITHEPEVGDIYDGKVVKVLEFGAIVEFAPGKDGMIHISELDMKRVNKVEDVVKRGDTVKVKIIKVDNGKIGLSRKALLASEVVKKAKENVSKSEATPKDYKYEKKGEIVDGTKSVRKV